MRNLKYSISNIGWEKEYDEEMYRFLSEHNFVGIEIAPTRIIEDSPYDNIEKAKNFIDNILKEYGLEICSMQSIWFGRTENIFHSKEERDALIDYTKKAVDFASQIGCRNLVFGCPRNRNIENLNDDYRNIALDFFRTIGNYAYEKKVIIAIEPNPVIYNTNFLNTTREVLDFVRELNMESIRVNCDLGTMIFNEEDVSMVIENIDLVNHIHISEPNLVPPCERELHKKLLDGLEKVGYSKFVSIEMKKQELSVVKEIIDYVANI